MSCCEIHDVYTTECFMVKERDENELDEQDENFHQVSEEFKKKKEREKKLKNIAFFGDILTIVGIIGSSVLEFFARQGETVREGGTSVLSATGKNAFLVFAQNIPIFVPIIACVRMVSALAWIASNRSNQKLLAKEEKLAFQNKKYGFRKAFGDNSNTGLLIGSAFFMGIMAATGFGLPIALGFGGLIGGLGYLGWAYSTYQDAKYEQKYSSNDAAKPYRIKEKKAYFRYAAFSGLSAVLGGLALATLAFPPLIPVGVVLGYVALACSGVSIFSFIQSTFYSKKAKKPSGLRSEIENMIEDNRLEALSKRLGKYKNLNDMKPNDVYMSCRDISEWMVMIGTHIKQVNMSDMFLEKFKDRQRQYSELEKIYNFRKGEFRANVTPEMKEKVLMFIRESHAFIVEYDQSMKNHLVSDKEEAILYKKISAACSSFGEAKGRWGRFRDRLRTLGNRKSAIISNANHLFRLSDELERNIAMGEQGLKDKLKPFKSEIASLISKLRAANNKEEVMACQSRFRAIAEEVKLIQLEVSSPSKSPNAFIIGPLVDDMIDSALEDKEKHRIENHVLLKQFIKHHSDEIDKVLESVIEDVLLRAKTRDTYSSRFMLVKALREHYGADRFDTLRENILQRRKDDWPGFDYIRLMKIFKTMKEIYLKEGESALDNFVLLRREEIQVIATKIKPDNIPREMAEYLLKNHHIDLSSPADLALDRRLSDERQALLDKNLFEPPSTDSLHRDDLPREVPMKVIRMSETSSQVAEYDETVAKLAQANLQKKAPPTIVPGGLNPPRPAEKPKDAQRPPSPISPKARL